MKQKVKLIAMLIIVLLCIAVLTLTADTKQLHQTYLPIINAIQNQDQVQQNNICPYPIPGPGEPCPNWTWTPRPTVTPGPTKTQTLFPTVVTPGDDMPTAPGWQPTQTALSIILTETAQP